MAEYIKREAVYSEICTDDNLSGYEKAYCCEIIKAIPAADVAPVVHGRWQGTADGYADGELVYDMWECSVCGFDADGAEEKPCWDFCPNCGAKMDLEALQ